MLLVVPYVPYQSGDPEVAMQAAMRLTKLERMYAHHFSQL